MHPIFANLEKGDNQILDSKKRVWNSFEELVFFLSILGIVWREDILEKEHGFSGNVRQSIAKFLSFKIGDQHFWTP